MHSMGPEVESSYCLHRLFTNHEIRWSQQCAQESAGKRDGTSGAKIGNAYLKWAFSEAAGLFLRKNPVGPKYLTRLEKNHGKGKA